MTKSDQRDGVSLFLNRKQWFDEVEQEDLTDYEDHLRGKKRLDGVMEITVLENEKNVQCLSYVRKCKKKPHSMLSHLERSKKERISLFKRRQI